MHIDIDANLAIYVVMAIAIVAVVKISAKHKE